MATGAYALAVATGTFNLAIDTIGTGHSASLVSGVGVQRVGQWHALLANAIKDAGNLLVHALGQTIGTALEERLFLMIGPVRDIATPATGLATHLRAALAVGAHHPATSGTGRAQKMAGTVAGGAGEDFVIALQALARIGRFQACHGWQIVVPNRQDRANGASGATRIRLGNRLQAARFPAGLQADFPGIILLPGDNIHIVAQFAGDLPVAGAPHIGQLANTLLFHVRGTARF